MLAILFHVLLLMLKSLPLTKNGNQPKQNLTHAYRVLTDMVIFFSNGKDIKVIPDDALRFYPFHASCDRGSI